MTAIEVTSSDAGNETVEDTKRVPPKGWREWRAQLRDRWLAARPTTRARIQVAVFVASVLVAYHYSLTTLLQSLSLDTPLAYVGLVPFIALGLAAVRCRPETAEPAIHDRQVDYIIGLPLIATSLAINFLLPQRMSAMFWVWRIDLLSLPFFVAGTAAIIFGVRALWRQRLAVCYLFLAWPLPYSAVLLKELSSVTGLTLHGLRMAVNVVHVGAPAHFSDGSVFDIIHHGKPFQLSVVSACSGVNGMVGFLLVGTAFGAVVTGPKVRKALWLVGGLLLLWVMNLGRLLFIFWVGQQFGEHFAIKVLHPFVGLVTFNVGVIVMLFLLKPAGLRIGTSSGAAEKPKLAADGSVAGPLAVPRIFSALSIVVVLGLIVGFTNSTLKNYDLVARADGEPKLSSFLTFPASPQGWNATFSTQYDFAKPFFGESSAWYRYTFGQTLGPTDLHSSNPIVADVVNTNDLSSFSAYGVEACYRFHGYSLHAVKQVSLGGGISGQSLSYTSSRDHQDWSIVYWIWPVKNGTSIRYERVILYALNTGFGTVNSTGAEGSSSAVSANANHANPNAEADFMVAFAREVVKAQAQIPIGAQLSRDVPTPQPLTLKRSPLRTLPTTPGRS